MYFKKNINLAKIKRDSHEMEVIKKWILLGERERERGDYIGSENRKTRVGSKRVLKQKALSFAFPVSFCESKETLKKTTHNTNINLHLHLHGSLISAPFITLTKKKKKIPLFPNLTRFCLSFSLSLSKTLTIPWLFLRLRPRFLPVIFRYFPLSVCVFIC